MEVLIVDDSAYTREKLRKIFEKSGFQVEEAGSGNEALKRVEKKPFDVITVDLIMPEMDGIDLIKILSRIAPNSRIIAITADIQAESQIQALLAGAEAVITKIAFEEEILKEVTGPSLHTLEAMQVDAFKELMNIASGKAALALNRLTGKRIGLVVPKIEVFKFRDFASYLNEKHPHSGLFIHQDFSGILEGLGGLLFSQEDGQTLSQTLFEMPLESLSQKETKFLEEFGNIVLNNSLSVLGDLLETRLKIGLPKVFVKPTALKILHEILGILPSVKMVFVVLSLLKINEIEVYSNLAFAFPEKDVHILLSALGL